MYFRKTCQTRAGKRQHDKLAKRTEKQKTEKAKRWLHACGREDFSRISDTKRGHLYLLTPFCWGEWTHR